MDIGPHERAPREQQSKLRQLERLFELAGALSRAKDPREIYRLAAQGLVQAVAADRAAVRIFDQDDVLRFKEWVGLSDDFRAAVERHTPWRRGVGGAQPVAIPNVLEDASLPASLHVFAKEGVRAVAFIPLTRNGELIGELSLYYNEPHEFQTDELGITQAIATHVALAAGQQHAESALLDSEGQFRATFFQAAVGIAQSSIQGEWMLLNDRFCELLGYRQAELRGKTFVSTTHLEDREANIVARRQLLASEISSWSMEQRYISKNGTTVWARVCESLVRDQNHIPQYFISVIEDISERKRAEAALRESEERFRVVADTAPVMICASGPDKLATFFNAGWLRFTGRTMEQELGYGWTESVHPDDVDACLASYSASFDARRNCRIEYRLRRADGEYRSILCNGVPRFVTDGFFAGYIASCIDITELKRTQEEAVARQKLESLGVLAGGIAHDFNNLLGGILAEAELMETDVSPHSYVGEGIRRIKTVATRGAEIVRELMTYAGQDQSSLIEPVDLSRLVEEMLELLKVSISKKATLEVELPKDLPAVLANAVQIRQVLLNLITNASEALGGTEGIISVTIAKEESGQDPLAKSQPDTSPGGNLRLEVSDTGCGMTTEILARIFDPFFTTKFAGRGLGLAAVQGIIRSHGGSINVASTSGQGSRFEILLPCIDRPAWDTRDIAVPASAREPGSVAGTVLVVEDEETLRHAVSKMLRIEGFSVIEAGDGTAGTNLFRANEPRIDAVLLDLTLPGLSGREVLEELLRIRPNLRVILTTAYSQHHAFSSIAAQRPWGYIRKPYEFRKLASLLRAACLDEPSAMKSSAAG